MTAARDLDGAGLRWAAMLAALAGHGAVAAALLMSASGESSVAPPSVLAVRWVGAEKAPAPPTPEPAAPPRPRPIMPRVRPVSPRAPAPVPAEAPAHAAPAAETALPVLAAVAGAGGAQAESPPVVAPRFDADYLSNPAPGYPAASRAMGEQGKVFLNVFVSPRGEPEEVRVRSGSGHERLDAAALDAVRHWKFVPARRGEETVAAWVVVPISFTLRR